MMWLMYRPAATTATAAPPQTREPARFNERELALLAELQQARNAVQQKRQAPTSVTVIEERAA